jgi:hypothetical protein
MRILAEVIGSLGFAYDGDVLYVRVLASHQGERISYQDFLDRRSRYQSDGARRKRNEVKRAQRMTQRLALRSGQAPA